MREIHQLQINPRNCGWMEVKTYADKVKAAEAKLEKIRKNGDNTDFQFRVVPMTVTDKEAEELLEELPEIVPSMAQCFRR